MSDVRRFDLKQCTACKGTGKQTIYKATTWESAPCLTCLGEGYVAAPAPEDKPAAISRDMARDIIQADIYREHLETELAAARAEVARLRGGIENMLLWAQTSPDISNKAYRIIGENTKALLNRKGDD